MAVVCEDLAQYGVVLVPPSTVEYFELLADIEQRLRTRPEGSPPIADAVLSRISEHDTSGSAILLNKAKVAIASMAYEWSNTMTVLPGTNPSVLLPFDMNERTKKFDAYWNTIFPGSKRLMTCDGSSYGDNMDVRPPGPDELSREGGWWSVGAARLEDGLKPVKLTLDGIFFVDGGFAGPNRLGSWEQTVFAADAHLACAALAREAHRKGTAAAEFFVELSAFTGQTDERRMPLPLPRFGESGAIDPEPIRRQALQTVGWNALHLRKNLGDGAAMARMEAWADAAVPKFHML